jgi:hypothetical protein
MIKSIWEKVKLAFGRKPEGDILLPPKELNTKVEVQVTVPATAKKPGRKKKTDAKEV